MPKLCSSGAGGYGAKGRGSAEWDCENYHHHENISEEEACAMCDTRKRPYKLCKEHWVKSTVKKNKTQVVKRFGNPKN